MLHCLLLTEVTGIRPSDVIPLHHVGLAASDLAPQMVEAFPNGPLEVSAIWKSLLSIAVIFLSSVVLFGALRELRHR